jgi:hypothetical protein
MKTVNSSKPETAAAVREFADFIDGFEHHLLDAMSRLEEMLEGGGDWLESLEPGTIAELQSALFEVGEARCAVSDLRVNNLRRILSGFRQVPAFAAAA